MREGHGIAVAAVAAVAILSLLLVACPTGAETHAATEAGSAYGLLDDALRAMAMARADLSFRTDYADTLDSFRLTAVDSLLVRPLDTEPYVLELARALGEPMPLASLVERAAMAIDRETVATREGVPKGDGTEGKQSSNPDVSGSTSPPVEDTAGTPGEARDPIEVLLSGVREASGIMEAAFEGMSDEERAFIAEHATTLLEEEEFDPDKPIDVRDRESALEEELGDELLRVAPLVDYSLIAHAGEVLAAAVDEALPLLGSWNGPERGAGSEPLSPDAAGGDVLLVFETDVGTVIVGGLGPTLYQGAFAIIVDLGGDDIYIDDATGCAPGMRASVTIDLHGDDRYLTGDDSAGAGCMAAGVLVDLEGNDIYSAGSFSQGSGLFGVGVLDDRAGNDTYAGDTCTQGSGAFGIGILRDCAGNDSYEAALFSQAFGFTGGIGALLDAAGNDRYFAGGKYTDEIRYFDHYLSLSQGFGYGWRPDASGGIGILSDSLGNDVYVSDIFGQGASYWFAVGGLVDGSGNDEYVSYQYAQGAGTHITVAALVDLEGDDNYISKGVSQGCGHDLAIGILHDLAGDDNYVCHDLSQGAGNANGIGIIADDSGNDSYSVRNPINTHGYGNYRRDYGSIGILLDGAGSDSYSGRGADGEWWMGSDHGIGIDRNIEEASE